MRSHSESNRSAITFMFLFAVGWFVVENVFGHRIRQPINLLQIVWCRYLVHIIVVMLVFHRQTFWRTGRPAYQLSRSVLMLTMPLGFVAVMLSGASGGQAWAGFWVAPPLMLVFGWLINHEPPRPIIVILACISSMAAIAVIGSFPSLEILPITGSIIMAASFAAYVAMTRSLQSEPIATNLFYTAIVPFVVLAPAMPFVWVTPELHDAFAIIGIGVTGFVSLYFLDLASGASPIAFTAPILPLLAVFPLLTALGDTEGFPTWSALFGATAIIAVAAFCLLSGNQKSRALS